MSDLHNTTAPVTDAATTAPAVTAVDAPAVAERVVAEPVIPGDAPAADSEAAATEPAAEAAPTEETAAETAAEKSVEPITQGQLAYKGPGLVKSLIPSKKEFWLSDDAVTPQNLDLFMRGEKPEISHAIVAWASQSGKGLLFFNKKNDADRTRPADVLALYDATDLKKQSPHEFSFKLNGHNHVFKATSDAERDGWYLSIEKAIELGKASKEEVRASEGYKAEIEKLNKPNVGVVGAAAKRSQSQPKKSTEVDKSAVERTGSSDGEDVDDKKQAQKSRSTSRGILNRLKGKKDEAEAESAEKKEVEQEEKKTNEEQTGPVLAETEAAPVLAGAAAAESPAAAEAAAIEPASDAAVVEEKPKAAKRASIFGKVSSTWGSLKSPAKEKELKDVELKPENKDAVVSENPPVLPETATTDPVAETAIPVVEEPAAETKSDAPKDLPADAVSPGTEKKNFLSGLGFMKRNRSVSPSTPMKEQPVKKEETPVAPIADEPIAAPVAVPAEEPVAEAPLVAETTETPAKVEEPKTETSTPNKRQSVLGSLGRRASKALNRIQAPKKEAPTAAATEAKKEDTAETKVADETPLVNGESKTTEPEEQPKIGDVVPDAVNVGQPQHTTPTVTASA